MFKKFSVWPTESVSFGICRSLVTFVIAGETRLKFRGKPISDFDRRLPFFGDSCHRGSRLAQGFVGNHILGGYSGLGCGFQESSEEPDQLSR